MNFWENMVLSNRYILSHEGSRETSIIPRKNAGTGLQCFNLPSESQLKQFHGNTTDDNQSSQQPDSRSTSPHYAIQSLRG